jgi:mediator of RNA polymerase II transcription subunit 16
MSPELRILLEADMILVRETNSPALSLLLISTSRQFLKLTCNCIRGGLNTLIKAQKGANSNPLVLAYRELEAVFQKSPVTVSQFDHLLSQLDASIKGTYQAGVSDVDRNVTEKDMLIKATIPSLLIGPVKDLLTKTAKELKEEVNVAEIYFTDIGWLGLTDDQSSKRWRMQHPIDTIRKTELKKDKPIKRCTRCGAMTEDRQSARGMTMQMTNLQRYCICGSWWMSVDREEVNGVGF